MHCSHTVLALTLLLWWPFPFSEAAIKGHTKLLASCQASHIAEIRLPASATANKDVS